MLEAGLFDAVIGMPSNLFYNTGLPACILVLRAAPRPGREKAVLFVDASRRFVKRGPRNEMESQDVAAIASAVLTGEDADGEGGVAMTLASLEEIKNNGWDLNITRYVHTAATAGLALDEALTLYVEARDSSRIAEEALDSRLREAGLIE
jgi:type I restriction enzyme M protein